MEHDVAYFRRRASEERTAASEADHPNARQAHLELAERYLEMAAAIADRQPGPEASQAQIAESVRLTA